MKKSFVYIKLQIILIITFFTIQVCCQDTWHYPIIPGTAEWAKLKSEKEIIAAQQIPDDVLKKMTTSEVFQAWIDLPGRIEILAFNTLQDGFNVVRKRFNVLNELLNRNDVGVIVLNEYMMSSPANLRNDWKSNKKGKFITDFAFLEILISQPEVLESLTNSQKKNLLTKVKKDIEIKRNFPKEDLNFFWVSSGLILAGRILQKESFEFRNISKSQKDIDNPLIRGEVFSKEEFDKLLNAINKSKI